MKITGAKLLILAGLFVVAMTVYAFFLPSKWDGVDIAVVQKQAEQYGGKVQNPLINLTGDLQLFVFTIAGFAGGAAVGYNWRTLFGKEAVEQAHRRAAERGVGKES